MILIWSCQTDGQIQTHVTTLLDRYLSHLRDGLKETLIYWNQINNFGEMKYVSSLYPKKYLAQS